MYPRARGLFYAHMFIGLFSVQHRCSGVHWMHCLLQEIATVPVDMGGPNGPVNLTIKEGDNLEAQLTQFVTKYGINENDKEVLRQEVRLPQLRKDCCVL